MPKVKEFDCVEMKNRIQANPILGPFYRRLTGKEDLPDKPTQSE